MYPIDELLENDDYGEPVISSIILHVFGDVLSTLKEDVDICIPMDEIASVIDSDFSIAKAALQTPLFQDILSDICFVRKLLLSNDEILRIEEANPGFINFINNDDSLSEIISLISDTTQYNDARHLRSMMIKKIEEALGNRFVSFIFFFTIFYIVL